MPALMRVIGRGHLLNAGIYAFGLEAGILCLWLDAGISCFSLKTHLMDF